MAWPSEVACQHSRGAHQHPFPFPVFVRWAFSLSLSRRQPGLCQYQQLNRHQLLALLLPLPGACPCLYSHQCPISRRCGMGSGQGWAGSPSENQFLRGDNACHPGRGDEWMLPYSWVLALGLTLHMPQPSEPYAVQLCSNVIPLHPSTIYRSPALSCLGP